MGKDLAHIGNKGGDWGIAKQFPTVAGVGDGNC